MAFVFLLGTFLTLQSSVALPGTADAVCKSTDVFRNSGLSISSPDGMLIYQLLFLDPV
jgi:hypothetical protein